jgi:fatty-acyl-CoA synthase
MEGQNVATTEVEAALSTDPQVEEATVFGVEVPGTGGRRHGRNSAQARARS